MVSFSFLHGHGLGLALMMSELISSLLITGVGAFSPLIGVATHWINNANPSFCVFPTSRRGRT